MGMTFGVDGLPARVVELVDGPGNALVQLAGQALDGPEVPQGNKKAAVKKKESF
jgi:hypothetical protein